MICALNNPGDRAALTALWLFFSLISHASNRLADAQDLDRNDAAAGQSSAANAIPRYALRVGQEIRYESTYEFIYDDSFVKRSSKLQPGDGHGDRIATSVWIVDRDDKGWQALLRAESTSWYKRGGQTENTEPILEVVSFVVNADGRISTDDPEADYFRIEDYFPRLPDDAEAIHDGWKSENPRLGRSYRYRRAAADDDAPDRWRFHIDVDDAMDPIVLASQSGQAVFDRQRKLVAEFEAEYTQKYGHVGRGVQSLRLTSVTHLEEARVAALRDDLHRLLEVRQAESAARRRAQQTTSAREIRRLFAESATSLAAARKTIRTDAFRAQLDALEASHSRDERHEMDDAERRGKLLGAAASDWRLSDLDGAEHSLAALRGKVVVLDFWYRGCQPCMRAMPQLKRLARQFTGRSVAIFGINTDQSPDDAAFVAERLKLGFPTLLAGDDGLMRAYGGVGFPTFVIIDQSGIIRHIHTGYTADLAKRAAEVIDALLKQD